MVRPAPRGALTDLAVLEPQSSERLELGLKMRCVTPPPPRLGTLGSLPRNHRALGSPPIGGSLGWLSFPRSPDFGPPRPGRAGPGPGRGGLGGGGIKKPGGLRQRAPREKTTSDTHTQHPRPRAHTPVHTHAQTHTRPPPHTRTRPQTPPPPHILTPGAEDNVWLFYKPDAADEGVGVLVASDMRGTQKTKISLGSTSTMI